MRLFCRVADCFRSDFRRRRSARRNTVLAAEIFVFDTAAAALVIGSAVDSGSPYQSRNPDYSYLTYLSYPVIGAGTCNVIRLRPLSTISCYSETSHCYTGICVLFRCSTWRVGRSDAFASIQLTAVSSEFTSCEGQCDDKFPTPIPITARAHCLPVLTLWCIIAGVRITDKFG